MKLETGFSSRGNDISKGLGARKSMARLGKMQIRFTAAGAWKGRQDEEHSEARRVIRKSSHFPVLTSLYFDWVKIEGFLKVGVERSDIHFSMLLWYYSTKKVAGDTKRQGLLRKVMIGVSVQKMVDQEDKGEQTIVPLVVTWLERGGGRGTDTIKHPLCATKYFKVFN